MAMSAVLAILRLQGAHLAVAGITPPNPASVRLHEALGFTPVGLFEEIGWKFGRWHGFAWMALELGRRGEPPAPFIPLPGIAPGPEIEVALNGRG